MRSNKTLQKAKNQKNGEFYTQLFDIERECEHYESHFYGKTVYCNCDDPRISNFFKYFSLQFERLGLRKLITTCYKNQHPDTFSRHQDARGVYLEYTGKVDKDQFPIDIKVSELQEDGDFRSPECIEFLKEADIVVTNPPFFLLREYFSQLMEYKKNFLIIGEANASGTKNVFPLIHGGKMWWGVSKRGMLFDVPDDHARELFDSGKGFKLVDGAVKKGT